MVTSLPNPEGLAALLRALLGGDRAYRKLVVQLDEPRSDGLVHYWQNIRLDALETRLGVTLPRRAEELRALLPELPRSTEMQADAVPEWIRIESLGGASPVQGSGTAGAWRWYFRARHNSWSLSAVCGSQEEPDDVISDSDTSFYAEDEYGDLPEEASDMPLAEARFLIVQELTRLKTSRGLGDS